MKKILIVYYVYWSIINVNLKFRKLIGLQFKITTEEQKRHWEEEFSYEYRYKLINKGCDGCLLLNTVVFVHGTHTLSLIIKLSCMLRVAVLCIVRLFNVGLTVELITS